MPDVERVQAQCSGPRIQKSVTGLLVAVLDIGDPGVRDLNTLFGNSLSELRLAEVVVNAYLFDSDHRS